MRGITKFFPVLAILFVILFLTASSLTVVSAPAGGSRFSGSVTVPQWEKGDKWGYKIPYYAYSSDYYGIGFEVVGTETVNGHECYKVKVWWDISYGTEENTYENNYNVPGFEYSYRYEGYVYFTKEKLAIAKYTIDLEMRNKYDGSEVLSGYTRAQSGYDYTDYLNDMQKWEYDIYYSFSIDYDYNPPFVMYDYPLELNKRWNSSSLVTISWEYATKITMNDAMKKDIQEMYGGNYPGLGAVDEEGSDSTQFNLNGEFEITDEDTIVTDTGTHEVFVIAYEISIGFTRASYTTPPSSYGSMSVPGGDATMSIAGCSEGYGNSYYDPELGYPQKMDTGSYYTESYSTVEPSSVQNSYDNLASSTKSDEDEDNGNSFLLLALAGVIVTVILVVLILLIVLLKRQKRYQQASQYSSHQTHERHPPQATQQQPYPLEHQPPPPMAQQVQQPPPPPRIRNP